jgi:hypothetical protein
VLRLTLAYASSKGVSVIFYKHDLGNQLCNENAFSSVRSTED